MTTGSHKEIHFTMSRLSIIKHERYRYPADWSTGGPYKFGDLIQQPEEVTGRHSHISTARHIYSLLNCQILVVHEDFPLGHIRVPWTIASPLSQLPTYTYSSQCKGSTRRPIQIPCPAFKDWSHDQESHLTCCVNTIMFS